jgi:hypothetical protein
MPRKFRGELCTVRKQKQRDVKCNEPEENVDMSLTENFIILHSIESR